MIARLMKGLFVEQVARQEFAKIRDNYK